MAGGLQGATSEHITRQVASVVKVDTKSGRLVRATVVNPRVVPQRIVAPPLAPAGAAATKSEGMPSGLRELAERIAKQHDVEPQLVDSVIKVESNYNPLAISPKGAEGLMQLVPSTARRFGVTDTFHPSQNIDGGVRYLKYLMTLFNGDERLALAAYNAGEAAVARYGGIPPYPETRNYVYQVGKKLGEARNASERKGKAAGEETKAAPGQPRIEKYVDAEGREYYRTR